MKKISSILLMAAVVVLSGCNKFLDRQPLDSASSATFMQTEEEMNLALNGVYAADIICEICLSNATPIA